MLEAVLFVLAAWGLLSWSALLSAIGAAGAGDPRVIPFLLLLGSVLGLATSPLDSALSRRWEPHADAFSLDLTGDPDVFPSTPPPPLPPRGLAPVFWSPPPTPPERIASAPPAP